METSSDLKLATQNLLQKPAKKPLAYQRDFFVLRAMISPAVNVTCPDAGAFVDPRMAPPTEEQVGYYCRAP